MKYFDNILMRTYVGDPVTDKYILFLFLFLYRVSHRQSLEEGKG
ncbi:MAG: hypothetical protein A4E63_02211 [Syntrophorhabdus sp. PtaU1.Bin050]|nr:MAG: hypothetical protein A4E63_02211 [Syntrophorhabdus sp. PtaU1.Bin050]